MNVLITGAAGYIGSMLLEAFSRNAGVDRLIGVDLKPMPERLADVRKLRWIQADVAEDDWMELASREAVDVVVHCAYQIRQLYGTAGAARQQRWNVDGARRVFEFALGEPSVRRLIHLSTISAYGARASNSLEMPFTEDLPLDEDTYLYGAQKARIEDLLRELHAASAGSTDAIVLRLASVSGPRGFALKRYGLVSTLAGKFPFVPFGRTDWCRQYLHEDDITDVVELLVRLPAQGRGLETFNVAPSDYLTAGDFAATLGKRSVRIPPLLLRPLFWMLWHATRGKVATPAGAWRFLSYPIRADGTRLTRELGYVYRYGSAAALLGREGRGARPVDPVAEPTAAG